MPIKLYETDFGEYYTGDSKNILKSKIGQKLKGNVQLILTSPPFPLNKKKSYGNLNGNEYKKWFSSLAKTFSDLIKQDGSIVIELGNSWEPKHPVQSLLHLESLLKFVKNPRANLRLCQEFICYNPSRLPSPAQWVTVNRIRTVDSFTRLWWMAKNDFPKSDNSKVLRPYSKSMKNLLARKQFNAGKRPSEHKINDKAFLNDNSGSIMHNVIELEQMDEKRDPRLPENIFSISNTSSNDYFSNKCREKGIKIHPARMPIPLALFFIEFLTEPGDIVLDPFAGSNTTGYCAELLGRKWVSMEIMNEYGKQSKIRFDDPKLTQI
ncbi:site-specific DNA-methyltransferase [Methanobacterium sp.]|uniref:DNA-methyltransferase n=1 Tax=Methanobacterium sp. TaxID=2164 RepID=UPI002ABA77EF|nr:site-specific DNA-methyltransferase [Methanobacterium sp.]MDY9924396.1 site-specific DNA-methyltransferase [Methanobacterium sp.]